MVSKATSYAANVKGYIIDAFKTALSEWQYLLGVLFLTLLSIYLSFSFSYGALPSTWKFVVMFGVGFGSLVAFMMLLGRLTIKVYNKPLLSFKDLFLSGVYAAAVLYLFILVYNIISYVFLLPIGNYLASSIIGLVLLFVFLIILNSYVLEVLKVFFLKSEVFSLYNVFARIFTKQYWYGLIIAFVVLMFVFPISYYIGKVIYLSTASLGLSQSIIYVIMSIFSTYMYLFVLAFYFRVFNLDQE